MKYFFTLLFISFFVSGCGVTPVLKQVIQGKKEVAIIVQKAEDNQTETTVPVKGQSLNDIMLETQIPFTTEMHGPETAMVKLAGVMSTEGKEWHLYIDDELRTGIDITKLNFNESAKISWRYETK